MMGENIMRGTEADGPDVVRVLMAGRVDMLIVERVESEWPEIGVQREHFVSQPGSDLGSSQLYCWSLYSKVSC
jgi:hypothetical protein